MAILSLVISFLAFVAAAGSTIYARRIALIERGRDQAARRPAISAVFEDYGGSYPCLEITNDGEEDLADVVAELREPLVGYVPAITALLSEDGSKRSRVDLGRLAASETKRLRVLQDEPGHQFGEAILYLHCGTADGSSWRVVVKADIPRLQTPSP